MGAGAFVCTCADDEEGPWEPRTPASRNTPCPSNPLGVKGCGEAGAIAAPAALMNAITDALGHEDIAMPATPQAVWRAAQKSARKMAAE